MAITSQQREIIKRCQASAIWFMREFVRIKHPGAGIVKFDPFHYQQAAVRSFRKNRFNIFKKCFADDSPIWTPSGPIAIQNVKPDELVYSYDEETGNIDTCRVIASWCSGERDTVTVQTATGHKSVCTPDHQFLTTSGWVEAVHLTSNHVIIEACESSNGRLISNTADGRVKSVKVSGRRSVYDLEVDKHHNFIVDRGVAHNCRQSGISKIAGIFALWFAMFSPHKTILIVSRTDRDSKGFLEENVKLPFRNLPEWMQDIWKPVANNEHSFYLPNGSKIDSLTSAPDVLRSHASSLNIIDEAAFIDHMDAMWAAGRPTLVHGGSIIVISTTNGIGTWYWNTWTDAEAKANDFVPLKVDWWDMNWRIDYVDALSGEKRHIAPTEGIRECTTKADIEKYGPYWSPWLEGEWRSLHEKGEGWKFAQEVLAQFLGSGNTVLSKSALIHVGTTVNDNYKLVSGPQTYIHPVTDEAEIIDFTPDEPEQGLWIWKEPVLATPDKFRGGVLIEKGTMAHVYVAGVDVATGKGRDYSAIEMFDIITQEQVAELMIRCLPSTFKKMIDRICRWYNIALTVVERNNGGDDLIDDLQRELMYPRLWRKTEVNDRPTNKPRAHAISYSHYGHFTGHTNKAVLNKYLIDNIRDVDGEGGFVIRSRRLYKQLQIYVRKRDRAGRDTGKTEAESGAGNHDDLVMGTALALIGVPDAVISDPSVAMPLAGSQVNWSYDNNRRLGELHEKFAAKGGSGLLMPITPALAATPDETAASELLRFAEQMGALPIEMKRDLLTPVNRKKHQI